MSIAGYVCLSSCSQSSYSHRDELGRAGIPNSGLVPYLRAFAIFVQLILFSNLAMCFYGREEPRLIFQELYKQTLFNVYVRVTPLNYSVLAYTIYCLQQFKTFIFIIFWRAQYFCNFCAFTKVKAF